ncbi:hypothetical protein [Streptomyces sp. 7N604]|uniref:hypothetical protein n=1 Tax=Streptomyces sp. 7N604 TaxID=3457415 RepID=UPI003FD54635
MSSIAAVCSTAVLSASTVLFGGAPAQASSWCSATQHKEFPTPGYDVDVYLDVCIVRTTSNYNKYYASIGGYFIDGGGSRNFDNFDIKVRLERNNADILTASCDETYPLNNADSGALQCWTAEYYTTSPGGLSADGAVVYNIDSDGAGDFTWSLTGSPEL